MQKLIRAVLIVSLVLGQGLVPMDVWAAPAKTKAKAKAKPKVTAKAAPAPAAAVATPPAPPAIPPKEPLVEVSVDSLEISETNTSTLGVLWGQTDSQGALTNNVLGIFERSVPSLFKVGELSRSALAAKIDALIQNNQARVLANPTLLTKSDFEANFLVGGEIPYPTVGQGGVQGVEFKKYGVSLKILPHIIPVQNLIDAQITVGVLNPDNSLAISINGTKVPGLSNREAGTKVQVKDGETVVIAGIKQTNREKTTVRVPVLGYIPILGLLFRHKEELTRQTSLVVFVTFRLIK